MRQIVVVALALLALCGAPARSAAASAVVLFDEGHGERFLAGRKGELDLSGLAAAFAGAGMEVRTRAGKLDVETLRGVTALVISGPFAPVAPDELEAIGAFLAAGGRVAVMVHVPQPIQGLLEKMGVQYSKGPIHEVEGVIDGRDTDFAVRRFARHPLNEGLAAMSVFGAWALRTDNPSAAIVATTGPRAWLDVDNDRRRSPGDPSGTVGTVVAGSFGKGAWVVFGDDAIFQNRFLAAYNAEAAKRLARWLASAPLATPAPKLQPAHPTGSGTIDL